MHYKKHLTASGIAAGALAVAIASGSAFAGDPLKIGSPESISGDWAPYTAAHGMRCAAEIMNEQGGVNDVPIELTIQDNKSDPGIALALAQEMLDAGVLAVGATLASDSLIPVAQWPAPNVCANRYVSPGTVIGKG